MEKDPTFSMLAPLNNTASIRLNLSIALLTSLEVNELLQTYPPYGTMIGGVILPILLNFSDGYNYFTISCDTVFLKILLLFQV